MGLFRKPEVRRGTIDVGWLMLDPKHSVIFFPPERVSRRSQQKPHAKSASRCPAILDVESRYFRIRCPYDIHLRFTRDKDGKPGLKNMLGDQSPVRKKQLSRIVHLMAEAEWRAPQHPVLQITAPYVFLADAHVMMSQLPPLMDFQPNPPPGLIMSGRLPIDIWPRPLNWAFEWHDTKKDLILRRGDPWFYVNFETDRPDSPFRMVEAELTDELAAYLEKIGDTVGYVSRTFSLFKAAERIRPKKLLVPSA
ncbi:MAG: hypothetical protein AAFY59_12225 [Pseudomonadota bacterium]